MSSLKTHAQRVRRKIAIATATAALAELVLGGATWAATRTWTGAVDNTFATPGNWDTGVPAATDDAVFSAPTATNLNPTLGAAQTVQSLTFNASPNTTITANGGSGFKLTVGGRTGDDVVVLGGNHLITQSDVGSTFVGFVHSNNFNFNIAPGASLEIAARINQTSSSNNVSMNGGGTLILSQNNGGTGGWNISTNGFTINNGTLVIRNSNAVGNTGNKWFVNSGGVIQLESNWLASTNVNGNIALNDGATLRSNLASRTIGTGTGSIVLSGTSTINTLSNLTINQDLSGTGSFTKTGTATFTIGNPNTYTGNTTIAEGTLTLAAAADISSSRSVNVQSGATLNATAAGFSVAANQTLGGAGAVSGTVTTLANSTLAPGMAGTAGTLTLNNDLVLGGGTLQLDLANVTTLGSGVNDLLSVAGSFNANNPTTISINKLNGALTSGTYTLATFAGAFGGGIGNLQLPAGIVTRQTLALVDPNTNPGKIDLTVSGSAASLNWKGNGSTNAWKTNGANIWLNGASPDKFFDWDQVTFSDDLGSNSSTVDMQGSVYPAVINAANNSVNYTLSGSGNFSDVGTLNKTGTGTFTIANTGANQALAVNVNAGTLVLSGPTNNFTAVTVNSGGTLTLANAAAYNVGAYNIQPGGTLNIGDGVTSGVGDAGALLSNNQGTVVYNHPDDWTSNTIISGSGTVKKQGAGVVTVNSSNTYTGQTIITQGTIMATGNASLGALPGGAVTISGTGSFDVGGFAAADTANFGLKQFNISGTGPSATVGLLTNSSSANRQINALQRLTLTADGIIGGPGRFDVRGPDNANMGALDLAGFTLTKVGTGTFGLVRDTVTDGNIHVVAGNLNVEQTTSLTGTGTITLDTTSFMQFNALTGTVSQNIVMNGGGMGDVTQAAGTVIASNIQLAQSSNINVNSAGGLTENGTISGVGTAGLSKSGSGTLTLTGTNTYSGTTTINNGVLSVSTAANLGNNTAGNGVVFGGTSTLLMTGPVASTLRPVTLNGNGTIDTGGFDSSFGGVDGTGTFTKNSAGTLTVNHVRSGNLTVNGGTLKMAADSSASGVSHVGALNIAAGAKLDLAANKLITTSPAGTWNGAAYTDTAGLVASGKGPSNAWNGTTGIVTSAAAAQNSNFTTIGVAKASDVRPATATATAIWAGQTITGTDTLLMYTYGGDATLDGKINVDDYIRIDSGISAGLTGWSNGDFNYDGKINIDDYTQFIDANIGIQGPQFPTTGGVDAGGGGSGVSAVPEPASLGLGLIGSAALALRRRRRREPRSH